MHGGPEMASLDSLAEAVFKKSGMVTHVMIADDSERYSLKYSVKLKADNSPHTITSFSFYGSFEECISYLTGWLHAVKNINREV